MGSVMFRNNCVLLQQQPQQKQQQNRNSISRTTATKVAEAAKNVEIAAIEAESEAKAVAAAIPIQSAKLAADAATVAVLDTKVTVAEANNLVAAAAVQRELAAVDLSE